MAGDESQHQAVWFPQQILGERRPGAALRFVTSVDPEGGFDGEMLAYDPPRLMEMRWGASRVRIELHAEGDGTRLVLSEILPDIGGAARNGAGWHECLDRLAAVVDDTVPLRWGRRWHEVHPAYVEAFGPAASTLEAPNGWDEQLPDDPYATRFPHYPSSTEQMSLTQAPKVAAAMGIRQPPGAVFEAFIDPAVTERFWIADSTGALAPGVNVTWTLTEEGATADVVVREFEPGSRLVFDWGADGDFATVDFRFEPWRDDGCHVTVNETGFHGSGDEVAAHAADSTGGFTMMLCALKALLEHGIELKAVTDRVPD